MKELIPYKLNALAKRLPVPLYAVGGVCRDYLAGLTCSRKDWDICAPLSADKVKTAAEEVGFTVSAVYKNTGTVRMEADGEEYEFTSFRSDRYVRGTHTPAEVFFTSDIALDARRRDFKCNAVYYDIKGGNFVDPLGGMADIENKRLTTTVEAGKVFGEDGLRLLRLCRIAAQMSFTPTPECVAGARLNCGLIADVAAERVWTELNYILHADEKYGISRAQGRGLRLLRDTGTLKFILPELALGDKMEQRKDFHAYDVLEHSIRCVEYADGEIRLAALLHDVGKPYCMINYGKFAMHEAEGARIAEDIMRRLRIPQKLAKQTRELIRWHMYDLSLATSENKIRKFIVAHGDILTPLLKLKQADFSACKDETSVAPCVKKWKTIYAKMEKEGVPLNLKQLDVKGDKLIASGISPAETGKTLAFLLGECAIGNVENSELKLIKFALARAGKH